MSRMMLKIRISLVLCSLLAMAVLSSTVAFAHSGAEREVRNAARKVFEDLKAHRYADLYHSLPELSRQRVSRESFEASLKRTEELYRLDRIEIGAVHVNGDIAVAETTMFGHVFKPLDSDGKIIAQQYLVKENGVWKVATGDRNLVRRFLSENPEFAKNFPVRQPRVLINRDGQWIDVSSLSQRRRG